MDSDRIIKLSDMKTGNMLYLLEEFLEHEEISRIEIAALSKCDNTTVTRAIRELLRRDLLITSGKREAAHGRPREMLRVNPDGRYLLGISLTPARIVGVACDFRGGIRQHQQVILPEHLSLTEWLSSLEQITASLLTFAGDRLAGMGLAVLGAFTCKDMILYNLAGKTALNGFNLREFFSTKFGQNPMVFNLFSCLTRRAINHNPALKQGILLLVAAGQGIGMSLANAGKVYLSEGYVGGEFGHNISELDGLPCTCGRHGCLETRASTASILTAAREQLQQPQLTLSQLQEMAQADDPRIREILVTAARFLGVALANQVNNLLPDNLLLTGTCLQLGQRYLNVLQESMNALLFPAATDRLKLILQPISDDAPAVGAAMQVAAELLANFQLFDQVCPVTKTKIRRTRRQ